MERRALWREWDDLPALFNLPIPQRRRKWWSGPFPGIEGLPVIMGIQNNGAFRAGRQNLAEHYRVAAGHGNKAWRNTSLLHHLRDRFCIFLDVRAVAGDVWNREQSNEFVHNLPRMLLAPLLCGDHGGVLATGSGSEKQDQGELDGAVHRASSEPPLIITM